MINERIAMLPDLRLLFSCLVMTSLCGSTALAQPAPDKRVTGAEDDIPVTRLKLQPARIGKPVLKYPLLPPYIDQTTGNAATLYYRALLTLRQPNLAPIRQKIVDMSSQRLRDLPIADVRFHAYLAPNAWEEFEMAARREHCEWDLPIRANRNLFMISLEDVFEAERAGRWLSLRARAQAQEGKIDRAILSLQTGYALSRHVGKIPILYSGLVGMSIATHMSQAVEEIAEMPGTPNLFWSLTSLPRPFFDLETAIQTEVAVPYQIFPFLKDVETAQHAPGEWQLMLEKLIVQLQTNADNSDGLFNVGAGTQFHRQWGVPFIAMRSYPGARQHLLDKGRTPEQIERMSVAQVLLIHCADSWDEATQEILKWHTLPYMEGREGMANSARIVTRMQSQQVLGASLPSMVMPSLWETYIGIVRAERRFAELRIIEALRHYAATHNRTFPAQLSDIKDVPIPNDPMTGKTFEYRLQGETAILEIGRNESRYHRKRFELTIAK